MIDGGAAVEMESSLARQPRSHRQLTETQTLSGLACTHAFIYAYDDGNLTRHTRPDGSVIDYRWNERNLLSKIISDTPPPVASTTYNRRNQIDTTVVENNLFTATRSYDAAGRLTGVTNGTLDTTAYVLTAAELLVHGLSFANSDQPEKARQPSSKRSSRIYQSVIPPKPRPRSRSSTKPSELLGIRSRFEVAGLK